MFSVLDGKTFKGYVKVLKLREWRKYSFIDYILSGLTLSLYVAIDFSNGNINWRNPKSLHHAKEDEVLFESESEEDLGELILQAQKKNNTVAGEDDNIEDAKKLALRQEGLRKKKFQMRETDNEYKRAIRMTLSILEQYDLDKHIPVFGFGAKLPPFY